MSSDYPMDLRLAHAHAKEAERLLGELEGQPSPEEVRLNGQGNFADELAEGHRRKLLLANTHSTLAIFYATVPPDA